MRRPGRAGWMLIVLPPVFFLLALFVGRYGIRIEETFRSLVGVSGVSEVFRSLVLRVRLPRALAALILGVSSGAAFGAALALLFSASAAAVQGSAFAVGLLAIGLVCVIGWRFGSATLVLVIGGILVSALFNALLGLIKYVADPLSTLPAITYWLLGSLGRSSWANILPLLVLTGLGLVFFFLVRWRLNLLTLTESEAASLGVRVVPFRTAVIVVGTIMIAASVSLAGMIGWIGLVIPHVARAWVGPDHAKLIPASAALGAATLVALDTIARTAMSSEIPLGILTGLIGVPAFFILFFRYLRERGEAR